MFRLQSGRKSNVEDTGPPQVSGVQIEEQRTYWREFFLEQRGKVKHMLGSLDKKLWVALDTDLKVNMIDPFAKSEQVILQLEEAELTINKHLEN